MDTGHDEGGAIDPFFRRFAASTVKAASFHIDPLKKLPRSRLASEAEIKPSMKRG